MGWNDHLEDALTCDECEDCEQECTEHEELCDTCGYYPCSCDEIYEAWKEQNGR